MYVVIDLIEHQSIKLVVVETWYSGISLLITKSVFLSTHWGRVTHICISNLTCAQPMRDGVTTIIGSDNGLSPGRGQTIIWSNADLLLTGPLGTNFNAIWVKILTFSFKKMHLKMSSAKWRSFCFGLNVLTTYIRYNISQPEGQIWGVFCEFDVISMLW